MKIHKYQSGLTLIEMMIAMIIGLLITGAVITIFVSNVKSTTETVKMTRLNQDLRSIVNLVSDELKRAGYSAVGDANYMLALSPTANCIIYAYDQNADGSTYDAATDRNGFRYDQDAKTISFGRSISGCDSSGWEALNDPAISPIIEFDITFNEPSPLLGTVTVNQVDVSLTGELQLNPGVARRTIKESIRVRNDEI